MHLRCRVKAIKGVILRGGCLVLIHSLTFVVDEKNWMMLAVVEEMVEVAVIVKLVQKLYKAWNHSKEKLSIGLISPYAAQAVAIGDKLEQTFQNHEKFKVNVKSIDGFQGGEEDIIIISTVRSNNGGSIGFLSSPQRTNVALTRARHCLWILGNERTLSLADSVWEALINDAKQRQCFFTADEDCDIGKTITDVKKELDQLEDLLSGESILFKIQDGSDNFRKSFRTLKPSYAKKWVINLLLKLASGWRPKKINVDWTCKGSSYVLKKFKVENYYVVCSIDIIKDSIYEQVFKVWDIFPMVETPKLLERLDSIFAMYSDDFVNRCKEKLFEGNLEVPKSWSVSHDIIRFKNNVNSTKLSTDARACAIDCRSYVENSKVSESLLLMKFYSLSTGAVNHLLSDLEGREVDLPFEVTDEEREIIKFPRSSFILGRSGTGKTTILTMKLYRMLQQYYVASQDCVAADNSVHISSQVGVGQYLGESRGTILRQLFVTRFRDVRDSSRHEGRRSVALQTFIRKNEEVYKKGKHDSKRSRQHYISLSDSRISTLSAEKREAIYNIFEAYEKMKMALGEFDLADFVIDIHIRVNNGNLPGDKMDFVYIDEVQDLTMRQISLFRYICKNVDEGFVFSGDTAQTIARGIDFSLSQNFRTHTGVLRLAQSVIDLICHFFPQSIDVLAPETSLIYGESPVVFEPGNDVILVRDDSARKEISNYIGDQALVLTIVSARASSFSWNTGVLSKTISCHPDIIFLSFKDVLLYNFFGSSPMSSQWRVVYEFLNEKDLLDANSPKSFPSFSQSRHNILCSELKQLYVAITRTRQRLWICENNEELSKPMFDYWKRLCLVQVRKIDDSLAEAMQRASSPEEWKLQGIKLFWEKNYEMAIMCFEKAGEERWETRAKACGLRAAADRLCVSNPEEGRVMLREAAEMFDSIGRVILQQNVSATWEILREQVINQKVSGKIYCAMSELRKAGECFSLAGSYEIAANVYAKDSFSKIACHRAPKEIFLTWPYIILSTGNSKHQGVVELIQDLILQSALEIFSVSSLWASGSQGWPLKSFPGKQELLTKAMSLAQRVSGTFHASLCGEAKILSNEHKSLSELMQCHISSKQYESHVGEVLSIRKLLDAHFRIKSAKYELEPELHIDPTLCIDRISKNQVSGGTLVYVWYLWKLHSLEIFECLDTVERLDFIRCEGTVKLCFSYFGVRLRHDLSVTCLLLNPDAAWVRNVDKRFMLQHRNVVTLDASHFASAARKYWHQELLSVGLRVLEALHALYKCSLVNPLSKYYQKDIISLRESEPYKNLLEEIISRNLGTRNELTYGQIGVVMIMLGSGKPKPELYEKITKRI
ncbi:UNVERIFIED_CONTAM: Helicase SEN1, partial [Sesamum angustifolium]